ncbi:sensor histidine kinase [Eubacteriales bacterium OttesenSCG-928-A19]|nr:sensor histidine kinase [Eubacteriales bacterium OttesenSCG-928-A19]
MDRKRSIPHTNLHSSKRDNLVLLFILPLIVVVSFWIWWTRMDITNEVVVYSETPEWHLYDYDFDEVFVRARGSIAEYVPNALLTPEEFEAADYIVGKPKNSADYLTSRFRLYVPEGRVYALTTHSVDFADRIYINGHLYQEIGRPAATREDMVAQTREQYYTVVPENGMIEIVQQVSNFVHRDGGNPTGFRIGSIKIVNQHYDRRGNMTAMEVGAFLLMTLAYLILFLFQRSYRANLYFALASLVWSLQTFVQGFRLLTAIYPAVTWVPTFRMEYASIPLTALFLMLGFDGMFKGLVQKPVKITGVVVCGAIALYYATADTLAMSYAKAMLHNVVYVLLAYMLLRFLWRLVRGDRSTEAIIIICALLVYLYATMRDHLYRNNITTFPDVAVAISDFALLMFTLFILTASIYGTMRQVRAAMEREQKLAVENAALDRVNQMKNELMANLTHELRTPLAVMSAYAQLTVEAMRKGEVSAQTTEDLKLISSESKRLADMASGVLGVFRNNESISDMTPFRLETVIEQVGRLAAPMLDKHKNALALEGIEDLPPAYGRAEECTQLLWNLLDNANAHMENGIIRIRTAVEGEPPMLAVTVQDSGTGMSPEVLAHVLERRVSGEASGTGLGLPICKEIVKAHGGTISVDSILGEGTTVRFTLPVAESEESQ